jgi:fructokinase
VRPIQTSDRDLYLQNGTRESPIIAIGEVIWDLFETSRRLGGAALNFAAHAQRLKHDVLLISAVGSDSLGEEAVRSITGLGLSTAFLQKAFQLRTGTARVQLGPGDQTRFAIDRPAAYNAVSISDETIEQLASHAPAWLYYGTLFSSMPTGEIGLHRLFSALPRVTRFYDLNLRPGCYSAGLVTRLLGAANVVKLNEEELSCVQQFTGLPSGTKAFCREGAERYGWKAVCITLGARGCAVFAGGEYVEAHGRAIDVADTVGAGDAFAAAFMHGLIAGWPVAEIATFANRVGALVASRHGAIPAWTLDEAVAL